MSNEAEYTHAALANPIAEGSFRWVAKGKYVSGPRVNQACVTKWFKTGAVFSKDYFRYDILAVDKALEIVNRFNQLGVVDKGDQDQRAASVALRGQLPRRLGWPDVARRAVHPELPKVQQQHRLEQRKYGMG